MQVAAAALRSLMLLAALTASSGAQALDATHPMAIARFAVHAMSLFPASRFALRLVGISDPVRIALFGIGSIQGGDYIVPPDAGPGIATLVAADSSALAVRTIHIVAPPRRIPLIAVASYDDGIVFHDQRTFALLGTLATGGSPSDITVDRGGTFSATDTAGDTITSVSLAPWSVRSISGVPLPDELLVDAPLGSLFVTERDVDGTGALARIDARGVTWVVTGRTAEGIALDSRRQRLYVADVNDDGITVVDARRMRIIGHVFGIPRAFGLALSGNGNRLYAISNEGPQTMFGAWGGVSEIAVGARGLRVIARSAGLTFPVGIALDDAAHRLFVTDEQTDEIYVLDARTLAQLHAPLRTCSVPWKPTFDPRTARLYVPCAGSDEVDVIDTRTLSRVLGAPFHTGGYPLAVSLWSP